MPLVYGPVFLYEIDQEIITVSFCNPVQYSGALNLNLLFSVILLADESFVTGSAKFYNMVDNNPEKSLMNMLFVPY